jgi:hypothetical protein
VFSPSDRSADDVVDVHTRCVLQIQAVMKFLMAATSQCGNMLTSNGQKQFALHRFREDIKRRG